MSNEIPNQQQQFPPQGYVQPVVYAPMSNGLATAAQVLGIIGFGLIAGWYLLGLIAASTVNIGLAIMVVGLVFLTFIGLILGIIAVIMGHIGMSKKYNGLGKKKATVGLVFGYLAIATFILIMAIGSQAAARF